LPPIEAVPRLEPGYELVRRQRRAEEEALRLVALVGREQGQLETSKNLGERGVI
jgi:hypothetical protein